MGKSDTARYRIVKGRSFRLADHDPGEVPVPALRRLHGKKNVEERSRALVREDLEALTEAQRQLWAHDRWAVLVVLQAMDAAGKDGVIGHVTSGLNPQGCRVQVFKQPSAEELDHDFLWRAAKALPERGTITIFNRSYYEEVLVVRVHPELLDAEKLPPKTRGSGFWRKRSESINEFERHLVRSGTLVLKFFLHLSKEEQRRRFLERIEERKKHWKFSAGDVRERAHWDEYQEAYEDAIRRTSTKWAPWYVIPADDKWVARALVADVLAQSIGALHDGYPETSPEQRRALDEAKRSLEAE